MNGSGKQRVRIYYPPDKEVIERYARRVCQSLAEKKGETYASSETIDGLTAFMKLVVRTKLKHLNKKADFSELLASR